VGAGAARNSRGDVLGVSRGAGTLGRRALLGADALGRRSLGAGSGRGRGRRVAAGETSISLQRDRHALLLVLDGLGVDVPEAEVSVRSSGERSGIACLPSALISCRARPEGRRASVSQTAVRAD
jgi:hypothetical protein